MSNKKSFRVSLGIVVTLGALVSGCGSLPQAVNPAADPVLSLRTEIKRGLTYQRVALGTDKLEIGQSRSRLEAVAAQYREIAGVVAYRGVQAGLTDVSTAMRDAQAYELKTKPAATSKSAIQSTQVLLDVVSQYQTTFLGAGQTIDAKLGRISSGSDWDGFYRKIKANKI